MMDIGVLFDLDGVIIDSESIYTEFWQEIDTLYPTGVANFALKIKGSTLPEILGSYFPDKEIQNHILQKIKLFETEMHYKPFPEAMRFIDELIAAGVRCAIVTSSSLKKMENLYLQNPGFRERFQAVVTGDMVSHSKPHPEPYLLGAREIGVDIKDCFVFEDSLSGIRSGNSAGATVIALATTLPYDDIKGKACKTIYDFTGFHIQDMLACRNTNKL